MLLFTSGAFAAGNHRAPAPSPTGAATQTTAGCDVPGAACDPSKTDHDNGVGNNCDPGYGQGNQAKMPPDEVNTTCRKSPASTRPSSTQHSASSPTTPCTATNTTAHHDNESTMGAANESSTAETHDSGIRNQSGAESCSTSGGVVITSNNKEERHESLLVTNNVSEILEKLIVAKRGNRMLSVTIVLNSQPFTVTISGVGQAMTVTINGQQVTMGELQTLVAGILVELRSSGVLTLGASGGQITITQVSPGAFTISLPNGVVLTFTGGVLSSGSTTIGSGSTATVGGVSVVNGTGANAASSTSTSSTGGVSAAVGSVRNGVSAAAGLPLAQTGLPLIVGLVGLFLIGLGLSARRRG